MRAESLCAAQATPVAHNCVQLLQAVNKYPKPTVPALSGSHDAPACIGLFTVLAPFAGKRAIAGIPEKDQ